LAFLVALVPVVALTVAVPFVNRVSPSVFGMPFVLLWIAAWVLVAPAFLWLVGRLERRW
jgi:hypothetical protein